MQVKFSAVIHVRIIILFFEHIFNQIKLQLTSTMIAIAKIIRTLEVLLVKIVYHIKITFLIIVQTKFE